MARRPKTGAETGDPKDKDPTKTDVPTPAAREPETTAVREPETSKTSAAREPKISVPDAREEEVPAIVQADPSLRASRTPTATIAMPMSDVGRPPEMPQTSAPPPLALGSVEDPTHMPGPKDIPAGAPQDPAPPPGSVPPGDSRSLRRGNEFALIYRVGTCVISRSGVVGTRGQWRVVEYPTSVFASSSYAKECSRFVSDGFSDYRA